jgi:hypothetical protein
MKQCKDMQSEKDTSHFCSHGVRQPVLVRVLPRNTADSIYLYLHIDIHSHVLSNNGNLF